MGARPLPTPGAPVQLSEADCLEHLHRATDGYLATTARALPVIVPVAITVDGGELLLGPLFDHRAELAAGTVVALTVGALSDQATGEGPWSVLAQGTLRAPRSAGTGRSPEGTLSCRAMDIELVTGWRRAPEGD